MQTLTFDFAEGCFLEGDGQGTANRHGFLAMTFWAQAATVSLARSSLGSVRESVFVFALSRTKVICRVRFIPEPAEVLDFAKGIAGLQATNLLKYKMRNGSWIAIRPSGTEPKLKMYCSLVEKDEAAAKKKFAVIRKNFEHVFDL